MTHLHTAANPALISHRAGSIPNSATVDFSDRIRELRGNGRHIIDLAGGDPDFDTPAVVRRAASAALDRGRTHYGPARGIAELRTAIAQSTRFGTDCPDPDHNVIVTCSAKYALSLALATIIDPGDVVVLIDPSWVSYEPLVRLNGGVIRRIAPSPWDDYRITDNVLATGGDGVRAVIVNSPTNPTGRVLDVAELDAIARFARNRNAYIISDEVYEHIVFDRPHRSIGAIAPERTLVINGLSKGFAMTGWRLGWLIAPPALIDAAARIQQHTVSCAPTFVQDAAVTALTSASADVQHMVATYRHRRDAAVAEFATARDISLLRPEGTFYGWLDVSATGLSGAEFAHRLLDESSVAVLPGEAFGPSAADHVRISLANATSAVMTGIQRLLDMSAQLRRSN